MITNKLMESLFPTKRLNPEKYNLVKYRAELIDAMNRILPLYGITNYLRICAFFGTCGVETDYFKTTLEYASGADYEWRTSLGNVLAGDGKRFRGRSLIQTTGRYNVWRVVCRFVKKLSGKDFSKDEPKYEDFRAYLASSDYDRLLKEADRLDCNFLANPEKLEDVAIATEAACIFWEENNLNAFADRGDFQELNGIVNRGDKDKIALGMDKRNALYRKCLKTVPRSITLELNKKDEQNQTVSDNSSDLSGLQSHNDQPVQPSPSDDSFLSSALDKNVSADAVKTALPSFGARVWRFLVRPLGLLYAALEAGNIAAWFGVVVAVAIVVYLIYIHRKDFLRLLEVLKSKFLS